MKVVVVLVLASERSERARERATEPVDMGAVCVYLH